MRQQFEVCKPSIANIGTIKLGGLLRCAKAKLRGKGDTRNQRELASVSSALTRVCAQLVKSHDI